MVRGWSAKITTTYGTQLHHYITLKALKNTIKRLKNSRISPLAIRFYRPMLPWLIENVTEDSAVSGDISNIKIEVSLLNIGEIK